MGEAKRRGTFEQRRSAAIKRDKEAMEQKRKKSAKFEERETDLLQTITTPEERQKQFNAQVFMSTLQSIAAKTTKRVNRQHLTAIDDDVKLKESKTTDDEN